MHKTSPSTPRQFDTFMLASGWALFVFSLFPYFLLIPIPSDTQPYAAIFAVMIFFVGSRVALPFPIWTFLVVVITALLVFISTGATLNGLRSVVGYASLFFISASVIILASQQIRLSDRLLDACVWIWFTVGAIQRFVAPSFITFALARSSTTDTRGVTGLAVEPSAYATMMLFIIMIYFFRGRERSWPVLVCVIQIVFFSQSTLGILFVLLVFGLYGLVRFSAPVALLSLTALAVLSLYLFVNAETLLAGTRVGAILNILYTRPQAIFVLDESIAARVSNIFFSINGALSDLFLPHGFDAWAPYASQQEQVFRDVFIKRGLSSDRIMSGYGAALFELGAIGFIIPIVMTIGVIRNFTVMNFGRASALLLMIHSLMFMPVPLALPIVGILIGELFVGRPVSAFPAPVVNLKSASAPLAQ